MPEPIALPLFAALAVSFLGRAVSGLSGDEGSALKLLGQGLEGVLSNEAHASLGKLLARFGDTTVDPQTGLPRNHDLMQASRDALRAACTVLVLEQAGRLDPLKPWLPAIRDHIRAGRLGKIPLIHARDDPHRDWIEALREAIASNGFERWHDRLVLNEQEIRDCFRGGQCRLRGVLAQRFLGWARIETQKFTEPPGFAGLVEHGWSVNFSAPTMTLDQVYGLFLREHLKKRPEVFRLYVADSLGELLAIRSDLVSKTELAAFEDWLAPQLGKVVDIARGIDSQVRAVLEGQAALVADVGQVKVWLFVLNLEVQRGNQAAREVRRALLRLEQRIEYAIAGIPIQRFQIPDPPERELDLLKAKHRAVDLVARDQDLASLWRWIEGEQAISARLIVGRAGTGKTRLAFELLVEIAERLPHWQAGLLTSSALRKFDATKQPSDWTWPAPTLLVVDYAQTLAEPLGKLFRALTHKRRQPGFPPLRILLLERDPTAWFDGLLNGEDSGGPCAVRKLFDPPAPVELTPIPAGTLRRAVLRGVTEEAARLANHWPPALPDEDDLAFARSLDRDLFAEPLNLYMAALASGELGLDAALNRSRTDLALALADKELRRIGRFARQPGNEAQERLLRHLAACACVERGFTAEESHRAVGEESDALRLDWPDGLGDLDQVLHEALPAEQLSVAPIEPDFIGEAVFLKTLAVQQPGTNRWELFSATIARCFRRDPYATASTVMHAFQNFGHVEKYGDALLDATERLIDAGLADRSLGLLASIESAFPDQTVALRPHAVRVTQAIYERLKSAFREDHALGPRAELGRVANNLANRLSELGRRSEALVPAEEAVKLRRALAEQNPDAFRPALAASLNNLANRLSEPG
jgi:hypothetical protein